MQGVKPAPSSSQANVLPSLFDVNAKLAAVPFVGSCGWVAGSIVTTGLVRSIVQRVRLQRALVPRRVASLDVEHMVAGREPRIGLRARARRERRAIEPAQVGRGRVVVREHEACGGRRSDARRSRRERRRRRRREVDRPAARRGRALVSRRVDGLHPEGVRACDQARIALGARAHGVRLAVEPAVERRARVLVREREGGIRTVGRIRRRAGDGRRRRRPSRPP